MRPWSRSQACGRHRGFGFRDHMLIDSIAKIGGRLVVVLHPPEPAMAFGAGVS